MGCCGIDVDDGQPAGSGGGSSGLQSIVAIDIDALTNVEGAWNLEGNLLDRSGNNLTLVDNGTGTLFYATIQGKQCAYVEPNTRLERASHDANLAITGALTIHVLYHQWGFQAGTNDGMVSFHDPGAHPDGHYLYLVYPSSGFKGVAWFSEPTPTIDPLGSWPPSQWTLHTFTRGGGADPVDVSYYVNGVLVNTGSGNKPTGGAASVFGLGCVARVGSSAWSGFYGDCVVQSEEMAAADILAVAQQVGTAPAS